MSAADATLEILNTIVSQSEDGPPLPHDFRFIPGDTIYFTFQVAHFAIQRNEELDASQIDISYDVALEDASGVPLVPAASDRIAVQLNSQDKNWLPKRRASFQVPNLIAAGEYELVVNVRDTFAHKESSVRVPIHIGGERVNPSGSVSVQQFRFLRDENDTRPLTVPAYRPGDTVYTKFDIVGFAMGKGNEYRVQYGLTVIAPNGKPFVQGENAATLQDATFYPAQFLPATLDVLTKPSSARGAYTLVLTVHDLVGNRSCEVKQVFSLE